MFSFNREKARKDIMPNDIMYLGKKVVEVPKLTPKLFKELTRATENLPALLLKLISIQDEETFQAYFIASMEFAADELVAVTSILSGLESEYLEENAGMSEIIRFLKAVSDKNDITPLVKNLMSLLSQMAPEETATE
jgi:hypothetical protein